MNRRRWLIGAAAVGVVGVGAAAALRTRRRMAPPAEVPPGAYVGPFGAESTAEEVTADLDLRGRTMLVTGVNSGLGLESMRVLTLRGADVIGTARSVEKPRPLPRASPGIRAA